MPKPPMSDEARTLLEQPNPAVIAVVRPDGQPVSVATWYLVEDDGRILVNMDAERRRNEYMRKEPRISLTALKDGAWYTHVSVQGRITEWRDDPDFTDIDRLSTHYGNGAYKNRTRPRISALVEIDNWHAWALGPPPLTTPHQQDGNAARSGSVSVKRASTWPTTSSRPGSSENSGPAVPSRALN
jgi:PPOX class probable F420-dependent enzyme